MVCRWVTGNKELINFDLIYAYEKDGVLQKERIIVYSYTVDIL